jgi:hypothetical protein
MSTYGDGTWAAVILAIALLAHEPWRWLGLALGRNIDVDGALFRWVRAVATALVAGLVARLVLYPAGALAGVALPVRLLAFGAGIAAFYAVRRNLAIGVLAASLVLVLGQVVATR